MGNAVLNIIKQQKRTTLANLHKARVATDSGVFNYGVDTDLFKLIQSNESYKDSLKLCINPYLTGTKLRTSGVNNFATKCYDLSPVKNDLTQATANNQPYLSKIAPIEKPALLNPNGDDCYLTHPTISFGASDAWTVEFNTNFSYSNNSLSYIATGTTSLISLQYITSRLRFDNASGVAQTTNIGSLLPIIGKNSTLHLVAVGNGSLTVYINGVFLQTISIATNIELNKLMSGVGATIYCGKLYHYSIFSKALSANEVASRSALLRNMFPEIESVPIGTQTWAVRNYEAVCTPQGTLIPEMQTATNTEKITNAADREFSSDTGFWVKNGASISISGGVGNFINSSAGHNFQVGYSASAVSGKWYKLTFTTTIASGSLAYNFGTNGPTITTSGTYTYYIRSTIAGQWFISARSAGTNATIDNVSCQEVGWADSQNLYDYVFANTAGTTEQKTYAAVKAAGMWCHYNNDPANGAIYGKIYNDFAIKLLDMDLSYYNAANPTTPWGYDVPDESDFNTLQTAIDNDANSLELIGSTYWTSGMGTNTTGFSALPAGYRKEDGTFSGINTTAMFGSTDMTQPRLGKSLRLIKR